MCRNGGVQEGDRETGYSNGGEDGLVHSIGLYPYTPYPATRFFTRCAFADRLSL
jgi:hypothetical protein